MLHNASKKSSKRVLTVFTFLTALTIAAGASPSRATDVEILREYKSWTVEHEYDPDENVQKCRAHVTNDYGRFALVVFETGKMFSVFGFEHDLVAGTWDKGFIADLILRVDNTRWTLANSRFDYFQNINVNMVVSDISDASAVHNYLTDLSNGNRVHLMDRNSKRILVSWSLSGSGVAIETLAECANLIGATDAKKADAEGLQGDKI